MLIMFIFIPQYSVQKHGMDTDTDHTVEGSFEFDLVAKWVSLNTEPANIDRLLHPVPGTI